MNNYYDSFSPNPSLSSVSILYSLSYGLSNSSNDNVIARVAVNSDFQNSRWLYGVLQIMCKK